MRQNTPVINQIRNFVTAIDFGTTTEDATTLNANAQDFTWSLNNLVHDGYLLVDDDGNYQLTTQGRVLCYFISQYALINVFGQFMGAGIDPNALVSAVGGNIASSGTTSGKVRRTRGARVAARTRRQYNR